MGLHLGNLRGRSRGDLLNTEGGELELKISKVLLQLSLGLLSQLVGLGVSRLHRMNKRLFMHEGRVGWMDIDMMGERLTIKR